MLADGNGGEPLKQPSTMNDTRAPPGQRKGGKQPIGRGFSNYGGSGMGAADGMDGVLSRTGKPKPQDASAPAERYSKAPAELVRGGCLAMEQPSGGARWHALLWHSATNGVDQCLLLHGALSARCVGAQLCLRVTNGKELTASEVRQTVEQSMALVVLLTTGVMSRPDTQARCAPRRGCFMSSRETHLNWKLEAGEPKNECK